MKENVQRKLIYFFIVFVGLYFIGFSIFSCDESNTVKRYYDVPHGQSNLNSLSTPEPYREVYEATYVCYSPEGQKHTLVSFIYPQDADSPKDYYGTIEEQAAAKIKNSAIELGLKLNDHFEKEIMIAHVYKQN